MKPIFIKEGSFDTEKKEKYSTSKVIDSYTMMLEELFLIRNPKYKFIPEYKSELNHFISVHTKNRNTNDCGVWVYYPWIDTLVHFLSNEEHQEIRTARNRNLINSDEQRKLYDFKIGVAGLSVGSHPALTCTMMGMCRTIKIADPDEISASNLNRIRYDFTRIGQKKCDVVEELIYQTNPYADVHAFNSGVSQENIGDFLDGINLLIEEVDNLEMKIMLRTEARKRGIPVIMATDNGDGIIVDIERYDLDRSTPLFNGAVGNITVENFKKMAPNEMPKFATKVAGPDVVDTKMLLSLSEVGKSIYSWPQLGDAATLCGVAVAYLVKSIALGAKIRTGKVEVNLDSIFDPNYETTESVEYRNGLRTNFKKVLGI